MRTPAVILISCTAGLAAGWGSAALFKGQEEASPTSTTAAQGSAPLAPRSARPLSSQARLDDVQACKDLIKAAREEDGRHPLLRRFDLERALRRWIELDPQGAFAAAESEQSASLRADLFRMWAELDPRAALDALKRGSGALVRDVANPFFVALMARDPALAAETLKEEPWKSGKHELLGWGFQEAVARAWMKSDPQAAIASLGLAGSLTNPDDGQKEILKEWAKIDFAAAWKYQMTGKPEGQSLILTQADPLLAAGLLAGSKEALAELEALPAEAKSPFGDRFNATPRGETAKCMVDADPAAALKWAESRPEGDPLAKEILAQAASKLASSDPVKALELITESKGAGRSWEDEGVFRESFASLAASDPAKAVEMIASMEPGHRKDAMSGYLTRMFAVDVEGTLDQCRAWLADPEMKKELPEAFAVAFSWGHGAGVRNPGPVLEAFPELDDAVTGYVLATWAKSDPQASAGWIEKRLADGKPVKELEDKGVLSEIAIAEPEFAAEWVTRLADPKVQVAAAKHLAINWGSFNPEATRKWAESLPDGEAKDAAVKGIEFAGKGYPGSSSDLFGTPGP
ncbi:hypothetical protein [Luteolibacter luteus]|uniref:HEAT repeat domain-containing protein n=1 Tax=Luteolibacter luteus TaxID=2728835 RepID=A0A858RJ10_9BACT|nr:hypothetical protein [Luteolibacter luteus]QJE96705.1 hypothetical protein HHL09_13240 [Luteolibacter luteus]